MSKNLNGFSQIWHQSRKWERQRLGLPLTWQRAEIVYVFFFFRNLQNNSLTGPVPESIAGLTNLNQL